MIIDTLVIVSNELQKREHIDQSKRLKDTTNNGYGVERVEIVNTVEDYERKIHGMSVKSIIVHNAQNYNKCLLDLLNTRIIRNN